MAEPASSSAAGDPASARLRLRQVLANIEEILSGAALVVVVLSVCCGVVTRYIAPQPAAWTGEIAAMGFAWLIFLGASAGFKHGAHVSIDMLVRALPSAVRRPIAAAVDLLVLAFCLYVVWLGIRFTIDNWDNPSAVLRLPLSITYAAVTVGFALMAVRHAQVALPRWRPSHGTPV